MSKKEIKKDELPFKGELSETELAALKLKHPGLKSIGFEYGDFFNQEERAIIYIKPFTLELYKAALKVAEADKTKLDLAQWVLVNLWIAGFDSKLISEDIEWFKNFAATAQVIVWQKAGEIKKK